MRRPLAAIPAAVLLLVIAAVASAGPRDAELGRLSADGPVTLASSLPGTALLKADHVKPGDRVSGMISLTNKGDRPGALQLGVTGRHDQPGIYGGRLSDVLKLKIEDLSGRVPPREVVDRASTFALGKLAGRETRSYRVTATFPDGGIPAGPFTGDNLLKGSSVEVALQWQLTAGPAPAAPPSRPRPRRRARPSAPARSTGGRPVLVFLRIPAQRVIGPRGLKVYATCEVTCKLRFTAKIDSAPLKKHKKRKTLQKTKVLKGERKWRKLRAGREQRIFLQLQPKARKKLKRRMHGHGRAGITIIVHMRSSAGSRTAKRRIVMRTYTSAKHHTTR